MRRNRMRSYTIDAEDEEDFIKEYEKAKRSRLSQLNFKEKEVQERISEVEEEETFSPKKIKKISFHYNDDEDDDYSGLGAINNNDDDEDDLLGKECEDDDIIKCGEEVMFKKDNNEEKEIEMLCYFLKNSVIGESKNMSNNESMKH